MQVQVILCSFHNLRKAFCFSNVNACIAPLWARKHLLPRLLSNMSGLEVPGFVVGVVGVVVAFKGAVDTALLIKSFFDDARADCGYLALSYHIKQTRL